MNVTGRSQCFLCGSEAICVNTDFGKRKFYQCSNEECGDYEISLNAMHKMENAPSQKQQVMRQVRMYRGTDKMIEVIMGPDNQIMGNPVPRNRQL